MEVAGCPLVSVRQKHDHHVKTALDNLRRLDEALKGMTEEVWLILYTTLGTLCHREHSLSARSTSVGSQKKQRRDWVCFGLVAVVSLMNKMCGCAGGIEKALRGGKCEGVEVRCNFAVILQEKDDTSLRLPRCGFSPQLNNLGTRRTISQEVEMVKAVAANSGLSGGVTTYYKCRNGHWYGVGNCGVRVERGTCPECGDTIGGTGYH